MGNSEAFTFRRAFIFAVVLIASGCDFQPLIHNQTNATPTPSGPTPTPVVPLSGRVDYSMGVATESWIAHADFNRDGYQDLVITKRTADEIIIHRGSIDGTFSAIADQTISVTAASQIVHVIATDLNDDNWADIAVVYWAKAALTVFYNDGTGTLQAGIDYAGPTQTITLTSADLDNDGLEDIITSNYGANRVTIYWGDVAGAEFTVTQNVSVGAAGTNPLRVLIADINKDGLKDILTANLNGNSITYVQNTGTRTFAALANPITYAGGSNPSDMDIADLNDDGNLDVAVSVRTLNLISIHQGAGDGTFGAGVTYATNSTPNGIRIVDYNGDGDLDVVNLCSSASPGLQVWLGDGSMTLLTPRTQVATVGNVMQMAIGNFNNSGNIDIAVTPSSGTSSFSVFYQ